MTAATIDVVDSFDLPTHSLMVVTQSLIAVPFGASMVSHAGTPPVSASLVGQRSDEQRCIEIERQ